MGSKTCQMHLSTMNMGWIFKTAIVFIFLTSVNGQLGSHRYTDLATNTEAIIGRVQRDSLNVSQECQDDMLNWSQHTQDGTDWAHTMSDAYGYPQSGFYQGDSIWEGTYLLCKHSDGMRNETNGNRGAHHCLVTWPGVFYPRAGVGMCVPKSCTESDILIYTRTGYGMIPSRIIGPIGFPSLDPSRQVDAQCIITLEEKQELMWKDPSAVAALSILFILIGFIVIATTVDVFLDQRLKKRKASVASSVLKGSAEMNGNAAHANGGLDNIAFTGDIKLIKNGSAASQSKQTPKEQSTFLRLLLSFSVCQHLPRMVQFQHSRGSLKCVNGIRSLAFLWIVLGHAFQLGVFLTAAPTIGNILDIIGHMGRYSYMVISTMEISVETFFVLSAMLTTISLLSKLDKETRPTPRTMILFYVHRFLRLTPVYMLLLMSYGCLFYYLGEGPLYPKTSDADTCRSIWWRHLLYVNNIFNSNGDDCMGWTWYLANDFQFYIISPLFIIPLFYFQKTGILLSVAASLGSITAQLVLHNKVATSEPGVIDAFYDVYVKPWARSSTYFVGILLGYTLWKTKCKKQNIHWLFVLFIWLCVFCLVWTVVYMPYFGARESAAGYTCYEGLKRVAFGLSVAWILYACITGYGGFVNDIMSWEGWLPIAKLSYVGYLFHPIIIYYNMYRRPIQSYYNTWDQTYEALGNVCVTLFGSLIISVCLEAPFGAMEKIIFEGNPPVRNSKGEETQEKWEDNHAYESTLYVEKTNNEQTAL